MRRYLHLIVPAVLAVGGPACETGGEPRILTLTGQVRDYFTATALSGVVLTWAGGAAVTSSATGSYQINNLNALDILFITGGLPNYRATRNEPVVLGTTSATADLALVSNADADRQYTSTGVTPVAGTAHVFVNLRNAAGQPHTGIAISEIGLLDTLNQGVGIGPFIFGSAGDMVPPTTLNVTTEFNGRSRFGFLNVPVGTWTLRVVYTDGTQQVKTAIVVTAADGVTLIRR